MRCGRRRVRGEFERDILEEKLRKEGIFWKERTENSLRKESFSFEREVLFGGLPRDISRRGENRERGLLAHFC